MSIAYPNPVLRTLLKQRLRIADPVKRRVQLERKTLSAIKVDVKATLGEAELTMRELRQLSKGDVVRLNRNLQSPIDLELDRRIKLKAQPGLFNQQVCVQVLLIDDDDEVRLSSMIKERAPNVSQDDQDVAGSPLGAAAVGAAAFMQTDEDISGLDQEYEDLGTVGEQSSFDESIEEADEDTSEPEPIGLADDDFVQSDEEDAGEYDDDYDPIMDDANEPESIEQTDPVDSFDGGAHESEENLGARDDDSSHQIDGTYSLDEAEDLGETTIQVRETVDDPSNNMTEGTTEFDDFEMLETEEDPLKTPETIGMNDVSQEEEEDDFSWDDLDDDF